MSARPAAQTSPQLDAVLVAVLVAVFLATRLWLLPLLPHGATPGLVYAEFAREAWIAAQRGTDRYTVHRNLARLVPGAPAGSEIVEYPPLALAFMDLAAWGTGSGRISDFSPEDYAVHYAWLVFAVDLLGFALLLVHLFRFGARRGVAARMWPALLYVAGGVVQSFLLYRRLDLPLAVMLAVAALLALRGAHWLFPIGALAVAVAFKIAPIVLLPVFVLGTLPVDWRERARLAVMAAVAGRVAAFAAVGAAVTLPFVWMNGWRALEFVTFHGGRGLHNESVPGSIVLALAWLGLDVQIVFAHGAHDLVSPLASTLSKLSHWGSLLAAGLVAAVLVKSWAPAVGAASAGARRPRSLAAADPDVFLRATVLVLAASLAAATVLSAQYVLWLLPLVPLLDPLAFRRSAPLYLVILLLTALVFPWLYGDVSGYSLIADMPMPDAPRAPGVAVLLARNLALLAFVLVAARDLFRREASGREASG